MLIYNKKKYLLMHIKNLPKFEVNKQISFNRKFINIIFMNNLELFLY